MATGSAPRVSPLEREYLAHLHAQWMQAKEAEEQAQLAFANALALAGTHLGLRGELFYDCESGLFTPPPDPHPVTESPPPDPYPTAFPE